MFCSLVPSSPANVCCPNASSAGSSSCARGTCCCTCGRSKAGSWCPQSASEVRAAASDARILHFCASLLASAVLFRRANPHPPAHPAHPTSLTCPSLAPIVVECCAAALLLPGWMAGVTVVSAAPAHRLACRCATPAVADDLAPLLRTLSTFFGANVLVWSPAFHSVLPEGCWDDVALASWAAPPAQQAAAAVKAAAAAAGDGGECVDEGAGQGGISADGEVDLTREESPQAGGSPRQLAAARWQAAFVDCFGSAGGWEALLQVSAARGWVPRGAHASCQGCLASAPVPQSFCRAVPNARSTCAPSRLARSC